MAISPGITEDNSGNTTLNLNVSSLAAARPNPPLSTYYPDYSFDKVLIDAAIASFIDSNKDKIVFTITGAPDALSFKYRVVLQSDVFASVTDTLTTNKTFTVSGLTPGNVYKIQVRAFQFANGSGDFGDLFTVERILLSSDPTRAINITNTPEYVDAFLKAPINTKTEINQYESLTDSFKNNSLSLSSPIILDETKTQMGEFSRFPDIGFTLAAEKYKNLFKQSINKSMLSLNNESKDSNIYSIAYKTFHEIPISIDTYTDSYYSFGSTILLDSSTESTGESGGLGFFVSGYGTNGYFLQIDSKKISGDINSSRRVKLLKVNNGSKIAMPDSQTSDATTKQLIIPGEPYKVDVKVKYAQDGSSADIVIYINGFKIAIKDTSPIYPTNTVALFSNIGNIFFDYIYGFKISGLEYNSDNLYNAYSNQFSKNSLKFVLGNKIFNKNERTEGSWKQTGYLEDFGKIAREIKKIEANFDNPSIPVGVTVGVNDNIYIIGSKIDNFKAEIYVMNNSGFFTPMTDGTTTLAVYGYSIYDSGTNEYKETENNPYTKDEPIAFESTWIQNEEDVKALSTWLNNQWAKGYIVIQAEIFGGALLSVGDIITVAYPYHNLTTSKKFLIQSVEHSFSEGVMNTSITCRSL